MFISVVCHDCFFSLGPYVSLEAARGSSTIEREYTSSEIMNFSRNARHAIVKSP